MIGWRVVFRVDSSFSIGSGHIVRCLTLAKALRDLGVECIFVSRPHAGNLLSVINQSGFKVLQLEAPGKHSSLPSGSGIRHASWLGATQMDDAQQTQKVLHALFEGQPVDWLIVDHYALDAQWELALRPLCRRLMVIDDLADRVHDCDLLLDQNLIAEYEHRYDDRLPVSCVRLLGPHYALLQEEYAEFHPRTPPRQGKIQRILIYFGGSDKHNLTGSALESILSLNRIELVVDVVISPNSYYASEIREQFAEHSQIRLLEMLPSLSPLMVAADLSIGAGGATTWERCCLGLPSLVVSVAENQIPIAKEMHDKGYIYYLGCENKIDRNSLSNILKMVLDQQVSAGDSKRCRELVDGNGVGRVLAHLILDTGSEFTARQANLSDENTMLLWANNPQMLRSVNRTEQITTVLEHRAFFYHCLRDLSRWQILIVETQEGRLPVGQVCFECVGGGWQISYSMLPTILGSDIISPALHTALCVLRQKVESCIVLGSTTNRDEVEYHSIESSGANGGAKKCLSISVCSDKNSWINPYISKLLLEWYFEGHNIAWTHDPKCLPGGDICFYLSCGRVINKEILSKYINNLVVHESGLPQGRGWSPMSWQILEGKNKVPISLFEADETVDSGVIYIQDWIELQGNELVDAWRENQAISTLKLCTRFVRQYPEILETAKHQQGVASYYSRRSPADSALDASESIADQFDLLRIVDNERYPAWFEWRGKKFILKILEE